MVLVCFVPQDRVWGGAPLRRTNNFNVGGSQISVFGVHLKKISVFGPLGSVPRCGISRL